MAPYGHEAAASSSGSHAVERDDIVTAYGSKMGR